MAIVTGTGAAIGIATTGIAIMAAAAVGMTTTGMALIEVTVTVVDMTDRAY